MQFVLQDEATLCIVEAVRKYFATSLLTTDWKWSTDKDKTKIVIVDSWPEEDRLLEERANGIIVVATSLGSSKELGFGQNLETVQDDDGNDMGQYYGGIVNLDINYDIMTYSKRETHRLADLLTIGLVRDVPNRVDVTSLHNLLLDMPRISNGGERQERISDQTVQWTNNLTQKWQSYWKGETVFSEEILSYLLTAEIDKLEGGTRTVEVSASS